MYLSSYDISGLPAFHNIQHIPISYAQFALRECEFPMCVGSVFVLLICVCVYIYKIVLI